MDVASRLQGVLRMCRGGVGFGEMVVSRLQVVLRMCRGGVGFGENGGGVTTTRVCGCCVHRRNATTVRHRSAQHCGSENDHSV